MLDKILTYSFYLLFFLTPLFWTSLNHELFEFNKMFLTYGFTVIIVGAWLLKIINHKSLIINRTPLDIPILLFLGANVLSTIFSIDTHTSIWGYYSRSNGGLLSIICYTLLYFAFTSNITRDQALKVLKMGLWGGLIVALYAIPEHFGASPSCLILRGELSGDCWVQDVEAGGFATLGQPNWLASYLGVLIFPCLYFLLSAQKKSTTILYTLYSIPLYFAFTFTYSRSGMLGFLTGLITFFVLSSSRAASEKPVPLGGMRGSNLKLKVVKWIPVLIAFLFINLYFGSALTGNFRPAITAPQST